MLRTLIFGCIGTDVFKVELYSCHKFAMDPQFLNRYIQHSILSLNSHLFSSTFGNHQITIVSKVYTSKIVIISKSDFIFLETHIHSVVDRYAQP
jgi:hypothetical protein